MERDGIGERVLVAGGTGYVGGRLVAALLDAGYEVRVIARNPSGAEAFDWSDRAEIVQADLLEAESLEGLFDSCVAAYYLVHGMGGGSDFRSTDAVAAENFRRAAETSDSMRRMIYLGGMGTDDHDESDHMASRHEVGVILADGPIPVTELRAAVIIGSGSVSFEMLRYLTDVLPVMTTPSWVRTECQPIAIRDVLRYLIGVLDDDEPVSRVLDIGGPDVVTYADMMQVYAEEAGLRRRWIIPVPVLTPSLSSRWVGLVTPLPSAIARPLIDSLRHRVVMSDHQIDRLVPHEPIPYREAVRLALSRVRDSNVPTRWSATAVNPATARPGDPEWAGGSVLTDHQFRDSDASRSQLFTAFSRIGGDNGWYTLDWAWRVRGVLDQVVGGPGLRRGRRHPTDLRPGDALDFWRVIEVVPGERLVLHAEMRLPGQAWLSWQIEELDAATDDEPNGDEPSGKQAGNDESDDVPRVVNVAAESITAAGRGRYRLHQHADFAPKGLWGRLYWAALVPFHVLIFARMLDRIAEWAESNEVGGAE